MVLTAAWTRTWGACPEGKPLLVDGNSGREWNGRELDLATSDAAGVLSAAGVERGTRVLLAATPSADAVIAAVGALRVGACVVPIDPEAALSQAATVARVTEARIAIVDSLADDRWGSVPTLTPADVAVLSPTRTAKADLDQASSDDLALTCFTSGTTGDPKAVPITHGQILIGCRGLIAAWEWNAGDVLVSALPLSHVHGLVVSAMGSLTAGGELVVLPRFDPEMIADEVERRRATMLFGVPTMWWRIDNEGLAGRLAGLRLAVSGSAPLDPALFERLGAQLGQAPVERYGMTETLILTSNPVHGSRKPGSVGLPLPGVELRIAGDGVVEVRGPTVMRGYLNRRDGEGFTADGWWRTGDLGQLDDDGYLHLTGRSSDLIITGGENVHPAEVERVLAEVDGVREIAVTGVPDERWGQVVGAFVVIEPGADRAAVLSKLDQVSRAHLVSFHQPRWWTVLPHLPRNAAGKLVRSQLAVASGT